MERPSYISLGHWDEWVIGSRVSFELTALNVESLTGVTGYDYLLYSSAIPRRKDLGSLYHHFLILKGVEQ